MIINNLVELVQKIFYNNTDNIIIIDISNRETYRFEQLSYKKILSFNIKNLDGIVVENNNIYIKIN